MNEEGCTPPHTDALPRRPVEGDPAFDRRLKAISGAGLVGCGAVLCAVVAADSPPGTAVSLLVTGAVGGLVATTVALLKFRGSETAATFAATTLVAVAVAEARPTSGLTVAFVPVAVFAAYFLSGRVLAGYVAFTAAGIAGGVLASDDPVPLRSWLVAMTAVLITTSMGRSLRERVRTLFHQLDEAARRDSLTGLLNRRGIEARLGHEVARATRTGRPVSVLIGDLDRFKALNDTYGHVAGDRALERVAALLGGETRAVDAVGRLGGDEFIVVLPEIGSDGAQAYAERLGRRVAAAFDDLPQSLTITFGIATLPEAGTTATALVAAADRRLVEAKGADSGAVPRR